MAKPASEDVLLQALALKLNCESLDDDVPGMEFRRLGLIAAANRLRNNLNDPGGAVGRRMKQVLQASLRFGGNEPEKSALFDAIFDVVDRQH